MSKTMNVRDVIESYRNKDMGTMGYVAGAVLAHMMNLDPKMYDWHMISSHTAAGRIIDRLEANKKVQDDVEYDHAIMAAVQVEFKRKK